jgi:hypothetical protein
MTFLFTDAALTLEDAWLGTICFGVPGHVKTVGARQIRILCSPFFSTVEACTCHLARLKIISKAFIGWKKRAWMPT